VHFAKWCGLGLSSVVFRRNRYVDFQARAKVHSPTVNYELE